MQRNELEMKFKFHEHDCLHKPLIGDEQCKCDKQIETVEEHKYLGLTIDSRFTWDTHINNVCKKIRSGGAAIMKLKNYIPVKVLKTVYHALIESVINYGIQSWKRHDSQQHKRLQNLQNKIIKSLLSNKKNRKYKTIEDKFKSLGILNITNLFKYKTIVMNYFNYKNKINKKHYNTRNNKSIIPLTFNKYGDRKNDTIITKIFNDMPENLKNLNKISDVKKRIKKWLITGT